MFCASVDDVDFMLVEFVGTCLLVEAGIVDDVCSRVSVIAVELIKTGLLVEDITF